MLDSTLAEVFTLRVNKIVCSKPHINFPVALVALCIEFSARDISCAQSDACWMVDKTQVNWNEQRKFYIA